MKAAKNWMEDSPSIMGFARYYAAHVKVEAEAEGQAKAILAVLAARSIAVNELAAERIRQCKDMTQLDVWLTRVALVADCDALFAEA